MTWCHRMVVVSKKSGSPRRCVDLQPLNRYATRETHHTPSPFHQARSVPRSTYKTVLDAWNGYHSVPLHEDDRHLTTFLTPWGRYRYRVAPQGYVSSGDGYTRRYDEIVMAAELSHDCVSWRRLLTQASRNRAAAAGQVVGGSARGPAGTRGDRPAVDRSRHPAAITGNLTPPLRHRDGIHRARPLRRLRTRVRAPTGPVRPL